MNIEFDFTNSEDGDISSYSYLSAFDFLSRRRKPIGLLTIKNAKINKQFLNQWIKSTNGYRTTVIHVTFDNCNFTELSPIEICNFIFRFIRTISMKIEGKCDHFIHELLEDDRIQKLHNIRIINNKKIELDDEILLTRLFKPGELEVLELKNIVLSHLFVNRLIQVSF